MNGDQILYQKCGEIFLTNKTNYTFLCYFCNELLYEFVEFRTHSLLHLNEVDLKSNKLSVNDSVSKIEKDLKLNCGNEFQGTQENVSRFEIKSEDVEFNGVESERNTKSDQNVEVSSVKSAFITNSFQSGRSDKEKIKRDHNERIFCSNCKLSFKPESHNNKICLKIQELIIKYDGDFISLLKEGIFFCNECRGYFQNYEELNNHHKSSKHCIENDQCKVCEFSTIMDSKADIPKTNRMIKEVRDEDNFVKKFDDIALRKKRFKCSSCERIFRTNSQMQNHMKIHSNERRYKCEECSAAFTVRHYLKAHIKRKHKDSPSFSCGSEGCDKKFKTVNLKKQHERTHCTVIAGFQCEMCGNYFKNKTNMVRHQRSVHVDEKLWPHQCEFCGKRFPRPGRLADHKRIHTGEKPFGCDICSKFFRKRSLLSNHKKLHSSETKYVCRLCEKGFKQAAGYWGHMKRHHDTIC